MTFLLLVNTMNPHLSRLKLKTLKLQPLLQKQYLAINEVQVRSGNYLEYCYVTEGTFKEVVITKLAFFSTFVFEKYLHVDKLNRLL
jgi:hypothetical protein